MNFEGGVAENQYKDDALSLLFAKHLSERYAGRKEELKKLAGYKKSDYYTTNATQLNLLLEYDLEYQVRNVYKLSEEATWDYFGANVEQNDIKVKHTKSLYSLMKS